MNICGREGRAPRALRAPGAHPTRSAAILDEVPQSAYCYYNQLVISYDGDKRLANIAKHGFDFVGAEEVFSGFAITREDRREHYGELRLQTLGLWNGVVVFVVHTPRGMRITSSPSARPRPMKRASTGNTFPTDRTDWERVRKLRDADIQHDADSPGTTEADWEGAVMKVAGTKVGTVRRRGPQKAPTKVSTTLRLPAETLARWKASGPGWQTRMSKLLQERAP